MGGLTHFLASPHEIVDWARGIRHLTSVHLSAYVTFYNRTILGKTFKFLIHFLIYKMKKKENFLFYAVLHFQRTKENMKLNFAKCGKDWLICHSSCFSFPLRTQLTCISQPHLLLSSGQWNGNKVMCSTSRHDQLKSPSWNLLSLSVFAHCTKSTLETEVRAEPQDGRSLGPWMTMSNAPYIQILFEENMNFIKLIYS